MSRRGAGRLAWGLVALAAVLMAATVLFLPEGLVEGPIIEVLVSLVFLAFGAVGALIVSRHPRNTIGWLFVVVCVGWGLASPMEPYLHYATARGWPGAVWVDWLSTWTWLVPFGFPFVFFALLFPDGRLPSRRWRPYAWIAGGYLLVAALTYALDPRPLPETGASNPLGVEAFAGSADWAEDAGLMGFIALTLASSASLVLRFRRSDRQVRQQVKWFLFAVGLLLLTLVVAGLVELLGFQTPQWLPDILFLVSLLSLPAATGIAILRYRLYDIDRVINQTVVYGLLTAALVGVYVAAVAGIGTVARGVTGQESNSLVIVVSTLAVAALFRPLRARLQTFIDRRFYRQRYDAAATLDGFSARLRDQVDLESLRNEVVLVVGTTMQPAHASLWLRPREEAEVGEAAG